MINNDIKVCCTVAGENLEEFLKNLEETQKVCKFVELRADYIKNLKLSDLDIIKKNTVVDNIFTCRSVTEGGKFEGDTGELLEIINKANDLQFNHIDIEISKLGYINFSKNNTKIIGSHHNFKETPNFEELSKICKNILSYKIVDIPKIATYVNSDEDLTTLKMLILSLRERYKAIIIGMGERGKDIRIAGPMLGTYLTFAYIGENNTAPGQISLEEFEKFYGKEKINKD